MNPDVRSPCRGRVVLAFAVGIALVGAGCAGSTPPQSVPSSMVNIPDGPSEPMWWTTPLVEKPVGEPRKTVVHIPADALFASGSDSIDGPAEATFRHAMKDAGLASVTRVDVACHTDSDGPDDYNQKLSERRAATVTRKLADAGFSTATILADGFGEAQPVADNATPTGKAQNRRCNVTVTAAE